MDNRQMVLREIPKIDELLMDEQLIFFMETTPRAVVVDAAREVIEEIRKDALAGTRTEVPKREAIVEEICRRITGKKKKNLKRLINGTGVVLHTNLGRARLCRGAVESVLSVADSYSNLEYDVKKGARGSRHDHVEQIIRRITGAEAAMVVNNNAAATMLCLSAMAYGKEVIVSRGELVEIGGSFRIPEIMEQSGAHLKEVGTTNKTKPSDYERAWNPETTGALMKVHTSNYRILGFTQEVTLKEMAALGKKMLRMSCSETRPSITVPVLKYSSKRLARSNTISAPTRSLDREVNAITVCAMAFSSSSGLSSRTKTLLMLLLPTRSRNRRISG